MTKLKKLLQNQTTEPLAKKDRSWACGALDKALNPQQMKLRLSSTAHLNDRVKLPAEQSEDELSDTPDDLHSREALSGSSLVACPTIFPRPRIHGSRIDNSRMSRPHPRFFQPRARGATRPMSSAQRIY